MEHGTVACGFMGKWEEFHVPYLPCSPSMDLHHGMKSIPARNAQSFVPRQKNLKRGRRGRGSGGIKEEGRRRNKSRRRSSSTVLGQQGSDNIKAAALRQQQGQQHREESLYSTCNSLYKGLLLTEAFSSHDGVHSDTSLPASSTFVFATCKLGVSSSFRVTIFRSDEPSGEEGNTNVKDPRSSAPSLSSEPWLPGVRTDASSLFPVRHGVKVAAFFPLRNRATRFFISEPLSRFRYDSESRDLLGSTDPRPKALRMRWGAWTGRGSGATGGNRRRAAAGVADTGAGGVRGRKSAGGDGILAFLEGGEGPAATSKTGCKEKGRRRSTARRRLRFSVRAPMATRLWTEKETVEASVPWTGLGFHWRERERERGREGEEP
ncbi:hypothetical protein MUK42_34460 [Musa troglodytarum]|uniref:Uncharacterized protein n=1 Tax=Musa troglodytarum TaxID=320322 RepID=A0A9E7EHE0_9LILI|nr:hypothetical protein MUK42_34460 [Musa troglodytarum]